ncbi:transcriptional regulator [Pseudacidovorax sp. NFM-22]|uniref:transcriptional regulator n=1 Tax=Pseudacidovorax sp. NFM-22 TaxID=2744469 RepID=UPI001F2AD374|nr:YdaS family helix-turn-helix protein [Pseudacidovorax sp. NFM-22]
MDLDTNRSADCLAALDDAIKAAGGVGALAERIGAAASAPSMWRKRGRVPAEHCPAIERETGVRCEALRPDVAWHVLRGCAAAPQAEGAHA